MFQYQRLMLKFRMIRIRAAGSYDPVCCKHVPQQTTRTSSLAGDEILGSKLYLLADRLFQASL